MKQIEESNAWLHKSHPRARFGCYVRVMYGFKELRGFRKPETYLQTLLWWLGVDLGRTANTRAKSDGRKVNVRALYRKFKFGFFKATRYVLL